MSTEDEQSFGLATDWLPWSRLAERIASGLAIPESQVAPQRGEFDDPVGYLRIDELGDAVWAPGFEDLDSSDSSDSQDCGV